MPDTVLTSLSLTTVHYDPTLPLSYLSAWLALSPQVLCITYTILILSTREVEIALTFAGQLACEAFNWILKRYIKQARPAAIRHLHKGYGMPSSHAQFISFWAVTVVLFLAFRYRVEGMSRQQQMAHRIMAVLVVVIAVAVAVSRVYLSYHTPAQVWVGVSVGSACALVWYVIVATMRQLGLIDWVLELEICRALRVRDLMCDVDLVEVGWREWEGRRAKRRAIKSNGNTKKIN